MTKRVRKSAANPGSMTVQSKVVDVGIPPYRERLIRSGFAVFQLPNALDKSRIDLVHRAASDAGDNHGVTSTPEWFRREARYLERVAMIVSGGLSNPIH
jgi:hypothetical protein